MARVCPGHGGGGAFSKGGRYLPREEGVTAFVGSQDGRNNTEGFREKEVKE